MTPEAVWEDARIAAALFATDPAGLGGLAIRGRAGPVRERLLAMLPGPARRLPANIGDEALFGGIDLAATLRAGRPVRGAGLLAELGAGLLVAPMAERLPVPLAARLAASMDGGAGFGLVVLDESVEPDECVPAALLDRVAFHIDLDVLSHRDAVGALPCGTVAAGSAEVGDELVEALCHAAAALGIGSVRAVLLAVRATRAAARLGGRAVATAEDAALAARLVLGPRATRLPSGAAEEDAAPEPPPDRPPEAPQQTQAGQDSAALAETLTDASALVLDAARAAIPAGLFTGLNQQDARGPARRAGAAGQRQKAAQAGRPVGVRAGLPGAGQRLNLVETLRAAAPWQRLRAPPEQQGRFPLHIRRDDFRIVRTEQRTRSTTVFVVDASGSAALNRLAEAKGAVELLLAECYRRRDEVALIAFRGRGAEIMLPPTRSLVRAKRSLATLPGGGGTPLAAGIDAGHALSLAVRRQGATPTLVLLTDGRANVTRAGTGGRTQAAQEALVSARKLHQAGIAAIFLDTSPRPSVDAGALARAMGARYVALPYADAAGVSRAIRARM